MRNIQAEELWARAMAPEPGPLQGGFAILYTVGVVSVLPVMGVSFVAVVWAAWRIAIGG